MTDPRRILLVGATGLIGRKVIARGRLVPGLALTALARRTLEMPRGGWASLITAPTAEWPEAIGRIAPDAVICALGTTRAKSGHAGLVAIDRDLVLYVARAAKLAGVRHFVLVSSVGADAASRAFYLATKGAAEQGVRGMDFSRLDILRPGLLRGARWQDERLGERIAQVLSPLIDAAMHGSLRRYRSIDAGTVAAAALQAVRHGGEGDFVREHDDLCELAARLPTARP